jgi:hypothetical protein
VGTVDHEKLASLVVIGKQLATHRLKTVTEFVRTEIVEGPPERCPVWDIVWLNVIECVPEGVIAPKAAFEGLE